VSPKQTAPAQEIILPGNVQPFITSPIYARTNGYLRKWYFDIGAHVKAGQFVAYMGDSGDAETTVPHLHFEIRLGGPNGDRTNPYPTLKSAGC